MQQYLLGIKRGLNRLLFRLGNTLQRYSSECAKTRLADSVLTDTKIGVIGINATYSLYAVKLVDVNTTVKVDDYKVVITITTTGIKTDDGITIEWYFNPKNTGVFYVNGIKTPLHDLYNHVYALIGKYSDFDTQKINTFISNVLSVERVSFVVYGQRRR